MVRKKRNLKKRIAAVGTVGIVALILSSTYAWNSISQKALNEEFVYKNPGARLHDDWNGRTSQIYVENFTGKNTDGTTDPSAVSVYVRVKIQEYMEFGKDAGVKTKENDRAVNTLYPGTSISDPKNWPAYIYGTQDAFQNYVEMITGIEKSVFYMPTFNKNKMSLKADINGTYGCFDDFVDYTDTNNSKKTANAYYYSEDRDALPAGYSDIGKTVEDTDPGAETTHIICEEEHEVATSLTTSKIISMEEWLSYDGTSEGQKKTGAYWVYDEDGWAYWADPLKSGEATGPLLTELHLKNTGDQNCYYAIKATGEFASAGDWGNEETEDASATGFYLNGITENALELLTEVADLSKEPVIEEPTAEEIAMEQIQAIKAGTATTVTIDDTEFYVLAKQEHQALLMQKEAVAADTFSDCSNKWEESEIRTYLNRKESGGWLNGKATLQNLVVPTKIHTITEYDNDTLASTTDQVFLLSEADVFGTSGAVTVTADHYTTGAKLAVPEEGWIAYDSSGKSVSWWLRSPCANGDYLADVHEDAELYAAQYRTEHLYIRPVLWVKF